MEKGTKNYEKKFIPKNNGEYLVTDQCFWQSEDLEEYNPLHPERTPHTMQLVDIKSGTIVNLPSGSIVKIVKINK
jgi:hypothetical protein